MKGIILAGGSGTRLYPLTKAISKQIMPVYDKPMIYYPLSTLMLAGIREVLIISTPRDLPVFEDLFGTGEQLGMNFSYAVQETPRGLADAFIVGKDFIGSDPVALVLGDNIFYGQSFSKLLRTVAARETGATIFGYYVEDPERFGIMEFKKISDDKDFGLKVLSVEEKPANPKSNYAIVGLYFYPAGVSDMAARVKPSPRGELEITTLNEMYLQQDCLHAQLLGRGFTWMDAGTIDSLRRATNFVCMIEQYQGMSISAPEEIAYRFGWISKEQLQESADKYGKSPYGEHLRAVLEDRIVL